MDANQIKNEVKAILADQFGKTVDEISDDVDLESFGADSLDTVEICIRNNNISGNLEFHRFCFSSFLL